MSRLPAHHEYERKIVTLAKVGTIEKGLGYVTVDLDLKIDMGGMHMRDQVKWRPKAKVGSRT